MNAGRDRIHEAHSVKIHCPFCGDETFDVDLDESDAFADKTRDDEYELNEDCSDCGQRLQIIRSDWGESGARGRVSYSFILGRL